MPKTIVEIVIEKRSNLIRPPSSQLPFPVEEQTEAESESAESESAESEFAESESAESESAESESDKKADSDDEFEFEVTSRHQLRTKGLDKLDELDEETEGTQKVTLTKHSNSKTDNNQHNLPPIPTFSPLKQTKPFLEKGQSRIADYIDIPHEDISPIDVFRLFLSDKILKQIVINTNYYAALKDAGEGREWNNLTIPELLIFIGICIYFGLFRCGAIESQWKKDTRRPIHRMLEYMTLFRFQQIRRFLHISLPNPDKTSYYSKLEPLLSHVRATSQEIYLPSSNLSVDEMMIRFSGRHAHTFRLKNKPIPEGFKILALCDYGYTWSFIPLSRIAANKEIVNEHSKTGLNETGCSVVSLIEQLPWKTQAFNIYMDNFFSSIPLFKYLRSNGIGACGTVRTNSARFPKQLKIDKKTALKFNWDTISGAVVDEVLAFLWVDNNLVTMLTTIHGLGDQWKIERNRRRPRITNVNKARVQDTWGTSPRKIVAIPKIIDDYNHYMGGVDIADQRRGYYNTQIMTRQNWMPLFYWLLDTAIINSHLAYKAAGSKMEHSTFRLELAWSLIKLACEREREIHQKKRKREEEQDQPPNLLPKKPLITKSHKPSPTRFTSDSHLPIYQEKRKACAWCRYEGRIGRIEISVKNPPQSNFVCCSCDVALCINNRCNCFNNYHTEKD